MKLGDKIINVCINKGRIKSAVIAKDVPCGDGAIGSWGVAFSSDIIKVGLTVYFNKVDEIEFENVDKTLITIQKE
jgi:hypothetical protein